MHSNDTLMAEVTETGTHENVIMHCLCCLPGEAKELGSLVSHIPCIDPPGPVGGNLPAAEIHKCGYE